MTTVNSNSNPNFWQKFKAGFSKNWKNGNIANWTSTVGKAAFGIGFTGMVIHDLNKNNNNCSIFGNRCCGGFSNFGMNSWYSGGIPYGMMSDPMGYSWMNQYGMQTDPYLIQQGNMFAAEAAIDFTNKLAAQMFKSTPKLINSNGELNEDVLETIAPERNNKKADKVAADTDKKAGEAFDKATNKLHDENGKINEDADAVVISKDHSDPEDYKNNLSNLSKSYLASIGADRNGGYISKSQFIEHEMKNSGATDDKDKAKQKLASQIAFARIDLNNDGEIDWKEQAAVFATFDGGGSADKDNKLDGKITAKEYDNAQKKLFAVDKDFSNALWENYKGLFGKGEK